MLMWKHSIQHVWETRPIEEVHKLFDRLPGIMDEIIQNGGERTCH